MKRLNIYYRKDGRYEGRLSKGKHRNGKRKYQYFFGRTREEVERKMLDTVQVQAADMNCNITVGQLFSEWFQSIRHRIKESTAANYMMKANKHILPKFSNFAVSHVSSAVILEFIDKKLNAGLSNRYVADIIILLKSMYKYAARTYHITSPLEGITLPRKKSSEIRLLDNNEQRKLQQYMQDNSDRTTLGISVSLHMGLRIGELCALQWSDIDLEKRILTVRKTIQRIQCPSSNTKTKLIITEPKSESSKRSIPIPEFLIGMLQRYSGKGNEYLLSGMVKPIEPRTMQYRFSKMLKNVNLPSVHFHALRHMVASNCVKLGFDVKALSEILGHSSVEITLNRYVHSSFEQKIEYMKRLSLAV